MRTRNIFLSAAIIVGISTDVLAAKPADPGKAHPDCSGSTLGAFISASAKAQNVKKDGVPPGQGPNKGVGALAKERECYTGALPRPSSDE
jgi:hypothetical protein